MTIYNDIKSEIIFIIQKILFIIIVYTVSTYIANYIISLLPSDNILYSQLKSIIYVSIIALGIIYILVSNGIEVNTILTILAGVSLTLALAFQSFISNIVATIYVLLINLFDIGDKITVGFNSGVVTSMNLINTTLIDDDNRLVIIPNSKFLDTAIIKLKKKSLETNLTV